MIPVGFSHSEISGSKPVCDSPELIAANYVLHRHLTPRHPSCALSSLTANLTRSPRNSSSLDEELRTRGLCKNLIGRCCHHYYRDTPSQVTAPVGARTPTPGRSCSGSSGCGIGRDRSSSSELQPLDSIDARFHSQDTLSRHCRAVCFSESFRCLSTPDPVSPAMERLRRCSIGHAVRFGGA